MAKNKPRPCMQGRGSIDLVKETVSRILCRFRSSKARLRNRALRLYVGVCPDARSGRSILYLTSSDKIGDDYLSGPRIAARL